VNSTGTFSLRVAELDIDPIRRRVTGTGGEVTIEPMVMRLLVQLADRRGQVVERRSLFEELWGRSQVGDDSLNRLVLSLRKALKRASKGRVIIETVPRVGYRLIGHADDEEIALPASRRSIVAAAACLAALGGAGVWSARREDGLDQGTRLTDRGNILLRDAVPMQAGEAVIPLRAAVDKDPRNPRALGLLALAEETAANNGGSSNPGEALRKAEAAARRALRLNPAEPHARLAMLDMTAGSLRWSQMEDRLEELRAGSPTNVHILGSLTSFLQAAGRTSRAWAYNEQAAEAAPSSPTPQWRRVLRLWTAGHTEMALSLSERLRPLWPHHALVWNARFMVLAFSGRTDAARAMLRDSAGTVGNAHPAKPAQWLPTLDAFASPDPRRVARAVEANLAAARLNPGQATYAAMVLSQLGAVDAAFQVIDSLLLEQGPMAQGRPIVARNFLANSPGWCRTQWLFMPPLAAIRRDPRFTALCDGVGLTRYWQERGVQPDTNIPV
jgi:DNA-binding winged helix-turn-helix (wHTH) protein